MIKGRELVCEFVRLSVERHLADLEKQNDEAFKFYFSEKQASRALNFFRALRHTKGALGGKPFNLQDNQAFILAILFGWRRKEGDTRRFTQAYIEEARKGGKSELAAGIEIYTGFFEGEEGAEVYTAATTRDQAGMVFRAAKKMCKYLKSDSKGLNKQIEVLANSVNYHPTDSFIQKVSADAGTLDGLNPHCAVIDEYHAHKTDSVKGVMQTGMGSRESPLLLIITTAGFEKEFPCFKVERANAVAVLKGDRNQDNLFAVIFTQDAGEIETIMSLDPEKPQDAREILRLARKSNPNLGSTPTEAYILEQVKDAQNKGSSTRVQVLTKNFNCWLDAPEVWIPDELVKACMRPIDISEFEGAQCFFGVDLGAVSDLTALAVLGIFDYDRKPIVKIFYWLPEDTVKTKKDIAPYEQWQEAGYLTTTSGNIADYNFIRKQIVDLSLTLNMVNISYDPYRVYELAGNLQNDGVPPEKFVICRQGPGNVNASIIKIEEGIKSDLFGIDENPITAWMFQNVALRRDAYGNVALDKKDKARKIDGVAAFMDSVFGYIETVAKPQSGSYLFNDETELITI